MQDDSAITLEKFRALLVAHEFTRLRGIVQQLPQPDLAEIIDRLEEDREFTIAFRLVRRSQRHLLFAALAKESQERLLDQFPDVMIAGFLEAMNPDDRTKLLETLSPAIQQRLIAQLSSDERRVARMLLAYPEESVGRMMTTDYVAVQSSFDVATALDEVRWVAAGLPREALRNVLVTDNRGGYLGFVGLVDLVTHPTTALVAAIMQCNVGALLVDHDREVAVVQFRKYDCDFMAVVDTEEKLCGVVTADDVLDVAEEEATEDMQQFGGQATLDEAYFSTPLFTLMRKRAGWLALLFVGELFTGSALKFYDSVIVQMGFLIYFIPLVISTGGNSGTQAAALIIRGIAVREMRTADWGKVFRREIIIGLSLGAFLGLMGYARAVTWNYDWKISLAIMLTIMSVVLFGALLGAMLPFLFKKIKLDPAVVSSPFIASLVDLFGIIALINIARVLVN